MKRPARSVVLTGRSWVWAECCNRMVKLGQRDGVKLAE